MQRNSDCRYCQRYGTACGREHTEATRDDWGRDWAGNAAPVAPEVTRDRVAGTYNVDVDGTTHTFPTERAAQHFITYDVAAPVAVPMTSVQGSPVITAREAYAKGYKSSRASVTEDVDGAEARFIAKYGDEHAAAWLAGWDDYSCGNGWSHSLADYVEQGS